MVDHNEDEKTYGDWFSGFGGMTIGAIEAGFKPVFACEYDKEIAGVYKDNLGDHVRVGDLLGMDNGVSHPTMPRSRSARKRRLQDMQGDWLRRAIANGAKHSEFVFKTPQFPRVAWKHDSPPCPNFSVAKKGAREGARETALAWKCAEYLMYARPRYYSLENVQGYAGSQSLEVILKTLVGLGYGYSCHVLNSADYGVPQTRKRLILRARCRWYATTEAARDPPISEEDSQKTSVVSIWRLIPASPVGRMARGRCRHSPFVPRQRVCRLATQENANDAACLTRRTHEHSAHVNRPRLWRTGDDHDGPPGLPPIAPERHSHARLERQHRPALDPGEPCYTIADTGRSGNAGRVLIAHEETGGRIAQLTVRALARIQTFPDWYRFPAGTESYQKKQRNSYTVGGEFPAELDRWQAEHLETSRSLSCRGIGNAVPPKMAEAIGKAWFKKTW